jgi:hypothetical protein
MKKIFIFSVFSMFLFLLVGCGNKYGEFPEFDDSEEIFMTSEEITNMLSSVDNESLLYDTMLLSMNLDISLKEELIDIWSYNITAESTSNINIQSKAYFSLSEDIKEVRMVSENIIDMISKTTYFEDSSLNKEQKVTGTFDAYFSNQYMYYNADLNGGSKYFDNGKYQMNVAITQAMWDEFYNDSDDLLGDYANIDLNIASNIDSKKMIKALLASEMISVYESNDITTVVLDIKKRDILDHAYQLLNGIYDTSSWTNSDFYNYKINIFEIPLNMFTFLETKFAFVIEDNQITKIGSQLYMYTMESGMKIEVTGTFVLDMFVEMPKIPNDLEDYELTEFSFDIF